MGRAKSWVEERPAWVWMAALAAVYFCAAKLGLRLALVHPSATPVWPPTGIALAALLCLGGRAWPAILTGAFLANLTTAGSALTSLGVASGNTAEGLVGAFLVRRFANGVRAFERPPDVFRFALLAGLLSTTVSASVGVTSLALGGFADWATSGSIWLTWWLGDAAGNLLIAPVLLLWLARDQPAWPRQRWLEGLLLLGTLVLLGLALFGDLLPPGLRNRPVEFLALPPLLWAAFRFGPREAASATALLSGLAVWGTLRGGGAFAAASPNASLLLLQTFMAGIGVTTLAVAAAVAERRRAEQALLRTAAIVGSSQDAIIGKTLDGSIVSWNAGAERLYGYRAEEVLGRPLSLLVPSTRADELPEILRRICQGEHVPPFETTRVRKDGRQVVVSLQVSPVPDAAGAIVGASAIARDVTERKRSERRQAASFAVSRILSASATVGEAAPGLLRALCEGLEWDQAELWRKSVETGLLRRECRWPAAAETLLRAEPAEPCEPGPGLPGLAWRFGRHVWVSDLAVARASLRAGAPAEMRGALAWPLRDAHHQQLAAVLVLYSREARQSTLELLDLMEDVARRVGQFIEREAHLAGLHRLRQAVETVELGVTISDQAGRIVYTNSAEAAMHGYSVEELIGRHVSVFMPYRWTSAEGRPAERRSWRRETVNVRRDGTIFPVQLLSDAVIGPDGKRIGTVTCCEEISERKRSEDALRSSEQRYRLLFERNLAGVYRAAPNGRLLECNEALARILGYATRDELLACGSAQLFFDVREREACLEQLALSGALTNFELRMRRKDGSTVWVLENLTWLAGDGEDAVEGTLIDITERKLAEEQSEFRAYHDALTGLPNRRLLEDRLHLALGHAQRKGRALAVIFLDLDRFKDVNDALGHAVGDLLLQAVAARLRECVREDDTLARLGGDEFVVLLPRIRGAQGAAGIAEKVLRSLERPFVLAGRELCVTGSAGVALYPQDGADAQALLARADAAMYGAKQRGRNGYLFCQPPPAAQELDPAR